MYEEFPSLVATSYQQAVPFNCWFDPYFDPAQVMTEMRCQLNGGYSYVEQTGFYLDPLSSEDWLYVSRQKAYSEIGRSLSYSSMAQMIGHMLAQQQNIQEIDVIILGPGNAEAEAIFVKHLTPFFQTMRIFLVEASATLLRHAQKSIQSTLQHMPEHSVFGIHGDFRNLWRYLNRISPPSPQRRRIIVAFSILCNLQDELHFMHNNFVQLLPGELVLFDFWNALACPEEPKRIQKLEPRLRNTLSDAGWEQALDVWHHNILRRYCNNFETARFSYALGLQGCPIPQSYSVDKLAHIQRKDGSQYTVVLQRDKRYHLDQLVGSLQREGLLPIRAWVSRKIKQFGLYLFEKVHPQQHTDSFFEEEP